MVPSAVPSSFRHLSQSGPLSAGLVPAFEAALAGAVFGVVLGGGRVVLRRAEDVGEEADEDEAELGHACAGGERLVEHIK